MIHNFAHHIINLMPPPGEQATPGSKAYATAVKEACKITGRINGALAMAGRTECAVIPPCPYFFSSAPGLVKLRAQAWEVIQQSRSIQWIILTEDSKNISNALPAAWIGKGFKNVSFGIVPTAGQDFSEKLEALRKSPAHHRMLLVVPSEQSPDLRENLKGIDWVVFAGDSDHAAQASAIRLACHEANVAFLFHITGHGQNNDPLAIPTGDDSLWPTHPFGPKLQLRRPTLPELKSMSAAIHAGSAPPLDTNFKHEALAVQAMTNEPFNGDKTAVFTSVEVAAEPFTREMSIATHVVQDISILGTERDDFERLDCLVRRNLQTFISVGKALLEIRERSLWRAGDHASWAAYCLSVGGLTKTHANRLISGSEFVEHLTQVTPTGVTPPVVMPSSEWQVRPLCRLKDSKQQVAAWSCAVERAGGKSPAASLISEVVAELMAEEQPSREAKPSRKQLLVEGFNRLRKEVLAGKSPTEVVGTIAEIVKILRLV